jgi:hypothetical protein
VESTLKVLMSSLYRTLYMYQLREPLQGSARVLRSDLITMDPGRCPGLPFTNAFGVSDVVIDAAYRNL